MSQDDQREWEMESGVDKPRNSPWNTFTFWNQGWINPETARGTLSLSGTKGGLTQKQTVEHFLFLEPEVE